MGYKTETTCFKKESVTETTYDRFGSEIRILGIIDYTHKCKKMPIINIVITPVEEDDWGNS
jgi:hypothetical protein